MCRRDVLYLQELTAEGLFHLLRLLSIISIVYA